MKKLMVDKSTDNKWLLSTQLEFLHHFFCETVKKANIRTKQ